MLLLAVNFFKIEDVVLSIDAIHLIAETLPLPNEEPDNDGIEIEYYISDSIESGSEEDQESETDESESGKAASDSYQSTPEDEGSESDD